MNIFQKQLVIDDRSLVEIHNAEADGKFHSDDPLHPIAIVQLPLPPVKVSVEEFEREMGRPRN